MQFLFATRVPNGYPTVTDGHRVDLMDLSGHYARWEEDFALVRDLGLDALRWGPAYYRVHTSPAVYDWEICDEPMRRLRDLGIVTIADLCHYGVPSWLGGFQDPAFPVLFAEYARAFARRYPWVRHFTPISRIFTTATRSALLGEWNECQRDEAAFVRALRNLCMAHELAVEAILGERPDATIVQCESLDRFHPAGREAIGEAERWNALRALSLDLTLGHELAPGMAGLLNAHGVTSNDLSFFRERRAPAQRWLGLVYTPELERRVASTGRRSTARQALGFRKLATAAWQRWRLPLFYAETSRSGRQATRWLKAQWDDVLALHAAGIPVTGFGWGALTDDAEPCRDARTNLAGLCDSRRRLRPVGFRYRNLAVKWRPLLQHELPAVAAEKREA